MKSDGSVVEAGDVVKNPKLAQTFRRVAADPFTFYNGSLAQDIIDDITEVGRLSLLYKLTNKYVVLLTIVSTATTITRSSAMAGRPCDAKACQG